ncbi:MAG: hypothetical protein OHK005_06490 [Candidatus Methylacidiphilales bacterium]
MDTKSIAVPLLVPAQIILNALPRDLVVCDVAAVVQSPEAQREVPLPLSTILSMLPSGRIELPAQDLIKLLPAGWTVPVEQVPDAYPISLPLASIVPRIPPEMLAIRPDQKDIDPAVRNMNDPFTQEMIDKLAAQAAAKAEGEGAAAQTEPEAVLEPAAPELEPESVAVPEPEPEPETGSEPSGETATSFGFESEPAPETALTQPEVESTPVETGEPDFASLRELALQANAAISTNEPEATAEESVEEPVAESSVEQPSPAPSEFGVKTLDDPLTEKISLQPESPDSPTPDLSSFRFDEPVAESETEASAEPEPEAKAAPGEFDASSFTLPEETATSVGEPKTEAEQVDEEPEAAIVSEPEPEAAAEPEVTTEVAPEPEPASEAESESVAKPQPLPMVSMVPPPPSLSAVAMPKEQRVPPPPPKIPPAISPTLPPPPAPPSLSQTGAIALPVTGELGHGAREIRIHLNSAGVEDLVKIPGVSARLARKILAWRELHGDFKEFSQLLSIPGMTKEIYRQFTGDPDSETSLSGQVNILLGAPLTEKLSLRDVVLHIRRWPSIQGCIIAGAEGLPIAKDVTDGDLAESLSAFLPRIMNHINETMEQIKAMAADEVHVVSEELGYFIYRRGGLYLVMLSSEKDLPEYYGKVVRALLEELTEGKKTRVEL